MEKSLMINIARVSDSTPFASLTTRIPRAFGTVADLSESKQVWANLCQSGPTWANLSQPAPIWAGLAQG